MPRRLLHDSLNRNRFKGKIMQHFKVLQRRSASDRTRGAVGRDDSKCKALRSLWRPMSTETQPCPFYRLTATTWPRLK
ncbi:hypothetical protein GHK48_10285 [Sinorhizobium fredii]|uniref:Uncharacterized protein n=1 Tax=Rhizobium fredii TaxID=380 RepID=A0A844A6B2_RHIFR|nr:hypothetical protein [Sinorhizobium fredii]MQX08664.1 hypothetical protein [Sinorhizobium fredii]